VSAYRCQTHDVTLAITEGPAGREHREIRRHLGQAANCALALGLTDRDLLAIVGGSDVRVALSGQTLVPEIIVRVED
jgi:hypothetical protein